MEVQDAVFDLKCPSGLLVGLLNLDCNLVCAGAWAVEVQSHEIEEHIVAEGVDEPGAHAGDIGVRALAGESHTQVFGTHQVHATPCGAFALIAELLIGVGQERKTLLIGRVGEHNVIAQFRSPTIIALCAGFMSNQPK